MTRWNRFLPIMVIPVVSVFLALPSRANGAEDGRRLLDEARSFNRLITRLGKREPPDTARTPPRPDRAFTLRQVILSASRRHGIPAPLIAAVIRCESNWNPDALSVKGARGLMQIMPGTAAGTFGVAPDLLWNPGVNIRVGTAYLRRLAGMFEGNPGDVIAAYNAGPTRVFRRHRLPRETVDYRRCVGRWYARYVPHFAPAPEVAGP